MGSIQVENGIDLRKLIVYTQTRTSCQQKTRVKSTFIGGRGGIGRHTILRGWRGDPCEFESRRPHQSQKQSGRNGNKCLCFSK